ncbi:response regulator [Terriglobus tenax]|uniref:response regulator n=1 Tax=Terriglobus tenax TaxID=1111115 RepID=UPI0021E094C5|nr:response regulator transcription factor [Terriglobus tenax]
MEGPNQIRILLADDHPMMRRGLVEEINAHNDMRVVAEASTGMEAISLYRQASPDVSLIDLRMPEIDGLETIRRIRAIDPNAKTVILTTSLADVQVLRAFQHGAFSYLLKSMLRAELIETLRTVAKGQKKVPGEVAVKLAEHALDQRLSEREIAVLQQASRGNSNKRIADVLRLSEHTVKTHFKNILQKLRAHDRTHAVAIAHRRGFFDVTEGL